MPQYEQINDTFIETKTAYDREMVRTAVSVVRYFSLGFVCEM